MGVRLEWVKDQRRSLLNSPRKVLRLGGGDRNTRMRLTGVDLVLAEVWRTQVGFWHGRTLTGAFVESQSEAQTVELVEKELKSLFSELIEQL